MNTERNYTFESSPPLKAGSSRLFVWHLISWCALVAFGVHSVAFKHKWKAVFKRDLSLFLKTESWRKSWVYKTERKFCLNQLTYKYFWDWKAPCSNHVWLKWMRNFLVPEETIDFRTKNSRFITAPNPNYEWELYHWLQRVFSGSKWKFQSSKHWCQLSVPCREDYDQPYFYCKKPF